MAVDSQNDYKKKSERTLALVTLAADKGKVRGSCLSDEEMACLVDGRCGEGALSEFSAHLSSCNQCYDEWVFLKKNRKNAPGGQLYHLSWLRRFGYLGTALAAAASIAVYLNVVQMEDRPLEERVVPQTQRLQDKNAGFQSSLPTGVNEKKEQIPPTAGQAPAVLPAVPAAAPVAVDRGTAKSRPEERPAFRQSGEKPQEAPQKAAATVPAKMERKMAFDAEKDGALLSTESALAPPAARPLEDIDNWLLQLRTACLSDQGDTRLLNDLAADGLRLQALKAGLPAGAAEEKMATVLLLLQGIGDPDTVLQQCRLILAELAKEDGSR